MLIHGITKGYLITIYKGTLRTKKSLDKATDLNPKKSDPWYYKGESLYRQGSYDEAILSFDQALNISNNETAWSRRGQALDKLGRYDEAVESFDKATNINPKNSNVWYYKGLSLCNAMKYEKAIESFDHVINIDPKNRTLSNTKGLDLDSLDVTNLDKNAIEAFHKAVGLDYENNNLSNIAGLTPDVLDDSFYKVIDKIIDKAIEIGSYKDDKIGAKGLSPKSFGSLTIDALDAKGELLESVGRLKKHNNLRENGVARS